MTDLDAALQRYFPGHERFLPGQREALAAVLNGDDVVAVLPTGGGKTLVYQLAGALLEGTTVIATPLIALMQDQVRRLTDETRRPVGALSGNVRGSGREKVLRDLVRGRLGFLFATPEQLSRDDVRGALAQAPVALFCIDEAHCISEWGYDFRPAYRELAGAAKAMGEARRQARGGRGSEMGEARRQARGRRGSEMGEARRQARGGRGSEMGRPPVLALTATAPEAVRRDVAHELGLRDPVLVARGFDRSNLHFDVVRVTDPDQRDRQLEAILHRVATPAVVYCTTRREAEETARALFDLGVVADGHQLTAGHYHGGMDRGLREEVQDAFLSDELDVLCATSAFGMGIDKPDIRAVVHRTLPDSLESYWQEAGRAGRDGAPADCVLLYRPEDRSVHEHLHRRSRPSEPTVAKMIHLFSQVDHPQPEVDAMAHVRELAGVARSGAASLLEDLDLFGYLKRSAAGLVWRGDPSQAMEDLATHHAMQVKVEQSRLDMVVSYAENTGCRRRYLLNYLGDEYPAELCLRCDNCLRRAQQRGPEDWDVDAERARVDADRSGPFDPGETVAHPAWGAGTVQRIEGEVLIVRFDSVGYRSMHAPTVVERGLLEPA